MKALGDWWDRWQEWTVQPTFALMHTLYVVLVVLLLWRGHVEVTRALTLAVLVPLAVLSALAVIHHTRRAWRLYRGAPLGRSYAPTPPLPRYGPAGPPPDPIRPAPPDVIRHASDTEDV